MKYISIFSTIIILASNIIIYAQTAQFETTIYFEDAIGNRDSITVGYDTSATFGIDPAFGEEVITTPFDSIFEVRADNRFSAPGDILSKRIIDKTFGLVQGCYTSPSVYFYIWAKHHPIKVSWDKNDFQDICMRGSALLDHQEDELAGPIPPWDISPIFSCMADTSSFTFELTEDAFLQTELGNNFRLKITKEVEGMGEQTIYGLRYHPVDIGGYGPCFWVTDTEEEIKNKNADIVIYPNPTSGILQINIPADQQNAKLDIFDMSGRKVKSVKSYIPEREIDVSGLPKGIYGVLMTGEGYRYSGRFVRM